MIKKYPIGTKIKFIGSVKRDTGKIGQIVGLFNNSPIIYLPLSKNQVKDDSLLGGKASWVCQWGEIKLLENTQLLFDFMYK